jgi:hypothetical protein
MQDIIYRFRFDDGSTASFAAGQLPGAGEDLPAWTALGCHQCRNCPLSADTTKHCPMAASLVPLIAAFSRRLSYETVTVEVESSERSVSKTTTIQRAVGSLMGLLAATSGCPRTAFLQPMAHFHLPFATEQETIYRVASMYLLAQYFERSRGSEPDWDLENLRANYQELQHVNAAMAARLREVSEKDGTLNALVLLDLFAKALPYSIDDALEDVRPVFG